MKKIFITFSFTILLIVRISGQVDVDIPLIVSDGTDNIPLAIGLDLTATNCIDPQLGESDLPLFRLAGVCLLVLIWLPMDVHTYHL
ncbi:MAG: hypothetical protein M5T52_21710 [Ignavibacteriaceae bacterium]|nr:hypothetical protein [Ignavibacteriaceae bacterium]